MRFFVQGLLHEAETGDVRGTGGKPLLPSQVGLEIRPPMIMVSPVGTATKVWIERVLIGGAGQGGAPRPAGSPRPAPRA